MRKAFPFRSLLIALALVCGIALAQAPKPAAALLICSPPTRNVCVNKECQCAEGQCSRCGVQSFTCNQTTYASTCVCKTC